MSTATTEQGLLFEQVAEALYLVDHPGLSWLDAPTGMADTYRLKARAAVAALSDHLMPADSCVKWLTGGWVYGTEGQARRVAEREGWQVMTCVQTPWKAVA